MDNKLQEYDEIDYCSDWDNIQEQLIAFAEINYLKEIDDETDNFDYAESLQMIIGLIVHTAKQAQGKTKSALEAKKWIDSRYLDYFCWCCRLSPDIVRNIINQKWELDK